VTDGLQQVWEKNFNDYRFCEFECCKDVCGHKVFEPSATQGNTEMAKIFKPKQPADIPSPFTPNIPNTPDRPSSPMVLYGAMRPIVTMYAVSPDQGTVFMYGTVDQGRITSSSGPGDSIQWVPPEKDKDEEKK
jgi:hypothetical protein